VYPPKLDQGLQESGAGLSALLIRKANEQVPVKGKQIKKRVKTLDLEAIQNDDEESEEEEEEVEKQDPKLFQKCVFWISREVPRYSLEFVITAMGGQCGWDATSGSGSPFTIDSEKITHVITDRPNVQMVQGKEYLQPQWVYDCVNQQGLVNTKGYHPGEQLPPHLSPFVVKDEEDYDPEKQVFLFNVA
jgi:pescadillo protein